MTASYGIVIPPWSFAADGGALLERAAGEITLDHVTVPAVTGSHSGLRLAADPERPWFHTDGGWHYPVPSGAYSAGVKPPRARWVTATDHLQRLRDQARRLGLGLALRVDLRAVRALIDAAPHLAQRSAWGQEMPAAGACIVNPELRELLRATLVDLSRYEPAAFELADWTVDHAPPAAWLQRWDPHARTLLTTCFCPACREVAARADVDPDAAARSIIDQIRSSGGRDAAKDDPAVSAYRTARHADCRRWLDNLASKLPAGPHYRLEAAGELPQAEMSGNWTRMVRLARPEPALRDADGVRAFIAELGRPPALAMNCWRPVFHDSASLVRTVVGAATAGVSRIVFEGLDESPDHVITWLKQAVRFAHREP